MNPCDDFKELRCLCGRLLAKASCNYIQVKCPRCKRFVLVRPATHGHDKNVEDRHQCACHERGRLK
jgi:phage FluMu protein Com